MNLTIDARTLDHELHALYWKNKLVADPPTPTRAGFPGQRRVGGLERIIHIIPDETHPKIETLRKQPALGVFIILASVVKVVIHKHSGSPDLVLWTPRHCSGSEPPSVLLPVCTRLSPTDRFRDYLAHVRRSVIDAYRHQDLSLDDIGGWLSLRDGQPGISNVMVSFEGLHGRVSQGQEDSIDLSIRFVPQRTGIELDIQYRPNLFTSQTASDFASQCTSVLVSTLTDSSARIDDLDWVPPAQRQRVLRDFNRTHRDYPLDQTLHGAFEAQAKRTPDRVAAVFESERITYRDLNSRANQLAALLTGRGFGEGDFIGLFCERNIEFVVAMLAVFKAGAAYVPIDPAYPRSRARYMLSNSEARIVITTQSLWESIQGVPLEGAKLGTVLLLDAGQVEGPMAGIELLTRRDWATLPATDPQPAATPHSRAYMIYTSGSTGHPKGAIIQHQGALNHMWAELESLAIGEDWVFLQSAASSFDISVWQFLAPLISGGRTTIAPNSVILNPSELLACMRREQVSIAEFVPALLSSFLEHVEALPPGGRALPSLRSMIVTGEALAPDLANRWFAMFPDIGLANCYGPTEASDDITQYVMRGPLPPHTETVPIGKPLANLDVFVLDAQLRPLPVGVPGEICVAGVGVGEGYWRQEERTKASFVANPITDSKGPVLYKTGDLGCWQADGNLVYLGRADDQVKIRGYRIELGEIEAELRRHAGVRQAAVLAREDRPGEKRLVGYVTARAGQELNAAVLREHLQKELPDYMTPAVYVVLAELPQMPNGKIDRRALPAPETGRSGERARKAPRNPVEQELARIWAEVLRQPEVGIEDNFFDLGGDSILSIHIVAKAGQAGLRLSSAQMFQYQTIAQLAPQVGGGPVEAEQGAVSGAVALTPIQQGFFEMELARPEHSNQAVLLAARRRLRGEWLYRAWSALMAHHDALRMRFERSPEGWRQENAGLSEGAPFSWVDLRELPGGCCQRAMEGACAALQGSLDLSRGPMLRVAYFDVGVRGGRMLAAIHHLVVDGVSWRILLEDLQQAYEQLERGEALRLPAKTTSFQRWSERLKEYAEGGALEPEREYWAAQGEPEAGQSPGRLEDTRLEDTEAAAEVVQAELGADETQALLQQAPAAHGTLINEVLLAALVEAWGRWKGSASLQVALEGHGREEILSGVDLTRTVGWFTSVFPVRLRRAASLLETLRGVKQELRAMPQRGIGYGLLRYSAGEARLGQAASPEVAFNYLGQVDQIFHGEALFQMAPESPGPSRAAANRRPYPIDINGQVRGGKLQFGFAFNPALYRRADMEELAGSFLASLRQVNRETDSTPSAVSPQVSTETFPLAALSEDQLKKLAARVNGSHSSS
jgi:amino acid adenylation domain-containing protein/non-ribosomal peptide synthase protein (TIGR01720 family)